MSRTPRSLASIIHGEYKRMSLLPILVIECTLIVLYFAINHYIAVHSASLLFAEVRTHLKEICAENADTMSEQFRSISGLAHVLQRENERHLGDRKSLDSLFASIYKSNGKIVAVYFNSRHSVGRYYPATPEVYNTIASKTHIPDFQHKRDAVWTDAYLDPARNAWMTSCIAPVYNDGVLEGVAGIDVTVDTDVKTVLNHALPWKGKAFLVDKRGFILAAPREVEQILGFNHRASKPGEFNLLKSKNSDVVRLMTRFINKGDALGDLRRGDSEYILTQSHIDETGWRMMLLVDKSAITANTRALEKLASVLGFAAIALAIGFYALFFAYLSRRIRMVSGRICNPIARLSDVTAQISNNVFKADMVQSGIAEIDTLSVNFNEMAASISRSESKYRSVFNAAGDPVFLIESESGVLRDANDAACERYGYGREELLKLNFMDLFAGDDDTPDGDFGERKILYHKKKDGTLFPAESIISSLAQDDQEFLIAAVHDFTEHKRVEDALAAERKLFIAGPTVIFKWRCEEGWPVEYASPNLEAQFGYAPEDLISGKIPYASIVHPDDLGRVAEEVSNYSELGLPYFEQEYRIRHADGEYRWIHDFTLIVRDSGGRITHYHGYITDVTEQKRAEEALRESEERYRVMVEAFDGLVYSCSQDYRIEFTNRKLAEHIGRDTVGELCHKALYDLDSPCQWCKSERVFEGEVTRWEVQSPRDNRWYIVVNTPIVHRGGSVSRQAMLTDITDRKHAEESLRKAHDELEAKVRQRTAELVKAKEVAESASRAKSEFLANMSHEIRTPMNGIIGMTELALDTPLRPEQRDYLEAVRNSADALLDVINDILDFSKIEARKLDLNPTDFNLRDGLVDIVRTLALRAHEKGLELACHILPDVPDTVLGDFNRLRQVVINLVGNAIKFTERGEVVVRVEAESRSPGEATLHFAVSDTGIGIPQGKQSTIFEAFEQVDGSATRKYGGTGLGLAISSRLVEMMGGRIWVKSEAGKGSTFHFTLPVSIQHDRSIQIPMKRVDLENLPVLVVDDNATNRRILEEMLRGWRMKPISVAGGKAALAEMKRANKAGGPFALVLLDACMPEMDGFSLADRIRRTPGLPKATIMMLSSTCHYGDAARCRELGITLHLVKPIKQSDLLDGILKVLGKALPAEGEAIESTSSPKAQAVERLRVLLAEDNSINQGLVVRILEKRGHEVVVTGDGRKALDAWKREHFDAVLMDVQMPEMDGFDTTAAIREIEKVTGKHIPIIAMTAHAMKGDREKCLNAGMDGYVSKPIHAGELIKAIESLAGSRKEDLDIDAVMVQLDGDRELLKEVAGLFQADCPKLLADIREALELGDGEALGLAAHTLKGTVGNFGYKPAFEASLRLEMIGRTGDWSHAEEAYKSLEEKLSRLNSALSSLDATEEAA
ncbi:MAG: response regulator [Armatimonadota bacterium]